MVNSVRQFIGVLVFAWLVAAWAGEPTSVTISVTGRIPQRAWERQVPGEVGLEAAALHTFSDFVGGRGVVVRHGFLVHEWGDVTKSADVASAVKPLFTHFLFRAVREGRITSLDESLLRWEPRLSDLNPDLGFKDRGITWRHCATQSSCYGLAESPGAAFAYNDWQMALFVDLLFNRVYAMPWSEVDGRLLLPWLEGELGCEDRPSLTAHAGGRQPGRLSISPRDFARFGLLYLGEGRWGGKRLLPVEDVHLATRNPLPAAFPRAGNRVAAMLPGQRTLGSQRVPDNQTEHFGSYSFLWWVNGVETSGARHWPDAPPSTFAALGHGGMRALVVLPELDVVASWNDARIDSPAKENEAIRRLMQAATNRPTSGTVVPRSPGLNRENPRVR